MIDFTKQEGESKLEYLYRVYEAKQSGELDDYTWEDIADRLNEELGLDWGESAWRKDCKALQKWKDYLVEHTDVETTVQTELDKKLEEIRLERVRLQDERVSRNREQRYLARLERKIETLEELVKDDGCKRYMLPETICIDDPKVSANELVVLLSDLHIGAFWGNGFGRYDVGIAGDLLSEYVYKIKELGKLYGCRKVAVAMVGDMISGNIHKSIAVTNELNVMEQVMAASDFVAGFITDMAGSFAQVKVCSVAGNHSRIDKKDDALKSERLDDLVTFIVKRSLAHLENVDFVEQLDNTVQTCYVAGLPFAFVHGDYDTLDERGVGKLVGLLGSKPYCICAGHKHGELWTEVMGVKVCQGGTLCPKGDDYSITHRLDGHPSQTCLVVNSEGVVAHVPMDLKY